METKIAEKKMYPPGVPCWVETLQRDPRAALAFYRALFGWEAIGPGAMPGGGEYFVARLHGSDVAGIATLPNDGVTAPQWTTYVCVDNVEKYVVRARAAGGRVIVGAVDAAPAGRLAVIAAPTGAVFGMWEPRDRPGAQRINEVGAWAMSGLLTRDVAAAAPFYTSVFGWKAEPFAMGGASGVLFRLPGYIGGLEKQPVPRDVVAVAIENAQHSDEGWSVDFWIDDVDAAVLRVTKSGGEVIVAPHDAAIFRRAVIGDPAGAVFTISQLMIERLA